MSAVTRFPLVLIRYLLRGPESEADKTDSMIQRFAQLPLRDKLDEMKAILRGFWLLRKFDTKGLIRAGKGIKIVKRGGEIHMDRYCHIWDGAEIAVLRKKKTPVLTIGYGAGIGAHTQINVTNSITIGAGTFIGWYCDVMDSDFHRVLWIDRKPRPVSQPVVFEERVFIGAHTIVLPGVRIGHDSVVGAGSVVTKDIPPYSFAAGCPARVITKIAGWDSRTDYDDYTGNGDENSGAF